MDPQGDRGPQVKNGCSRGSACQPVGLNQQYMPKKRQSSSLGQPRILDELSTSLLFLVITVHIYICKAYCVKMFRLDIFLVRLQGLKMESTGVLISP